MFGTRHFDTTVESKLPIFAIRQDAISKIHDDSDPATRVSNQQQYERRVHGIAYLGVQQL
jgi:hypothetical protein